LTQILDNYIDWNISRQIVWGIRIPAFKHAQTGKWRVETDTDIQKELISSGEWIQDTDTFDTWFSSGQWPFATIMAIAAKEHHVEVSDLYEIITQTASLETRNSQLAASAAFFNYYYPTSVMETGYDIARAWVARMMMLGYFVTGKPPFKEVYLHGMVRDGKGQKMSKSKGNVIDPLKLTEKYGTDALRAALIFGTTAGNDASLSEEKVKGMRNFMNKIWNIARFLTLPPTTLTDTDHTQTKLPPDVLQTLQMEFVTLQESHIKHMAAYDYSQALQDIHEFIWHRFADHYIEVCKEAIRYGDISVRTTLQKIFDGCIDMLDPFTPFLCQTIRTVTSGSKNELHEVQ
jgi:valyl-tRNA synthetase